MIIYFSWSGNTRHVAGLLQQKTGAGLCELEVAIPYPPRYGACEEEWRRERDSRADRALKTSLPDLSACRTVFLGYPVWGGNIPTPVITLLRHNDFSGKVIAPFCTHGGGGEGRSFGSIARLAHGARVLKGFSVRGRGSSSLGKDLDAWLARIG